MEQFIEYIKGPWPWYVAGPLIGLTVPILLLIGNKSLGISSSLRHICAACAPARIPFFQYDWKKESWNLFFVAGIFLGGLVATQLLTHSETIKISPNTVADLEALGLYNFTGLLPTEIFNPGNLLNAKGLVFFVAGGFLVGFGTRYAGGCTSGHAIMGISNLQIPSMIATAFFMVGGFVMTHLLMPYIFMWLNF